MKSEGQFKCKCDTHAMVVSAEALWEYRSL